MIFRPLFEPEFSTYTYLFGRRETGQPILLDPVIKTVERDSWAVVSGRWWKLGSSFFCVHIHEMKVAVFSRGCEHSVAQEIEPGTAVHGSLDDLQPVDLSLDRTGAPGHRQGGMVRAACTASRS